MIAVAAWLRRLLWRGVLAGTGGLRVAGALPDGPCVLVANHSSHADTAVLLATLPARRRPAVLAAADYWFAHPARRLACRTLTGAVPVHRHGGGSADLHAAAALLAAGRTVIVYPEGTRTRDGSLGRFHGGAERLAVAGGAALVPVGITGTGALLPVHGHPHRAPVRVRLGAPVGGTAAARDEVRRLCAPVPGHQSAARTDQSAARANRVRVHNRPPDLGRGAVPDSRLRQRLARFAGSGYGVAAVATWSVAEALSWPLVPEFALAILVVAAPRRAWPLVPVAALASLAGGALMYTLAAHGITVPMPLTPPRMRANAAAAIAAQGAAAVAGQPASGVPYKVYALLAGRAHVDLGRFLLASVLGRGLRIVTIGAVAAAFGAAAARWRRWYPYYLLAFVTLFTAGLAAVVQSWS